MEMSSKELYVSEFLTELLSSLKKSNPTKCEEYGGSLLSPKQPSRGVWNSVGAELPSESFQSVTEVAFISLSSEDKRNTVKVLH